MDEPVRRRSFVRLVAAEAVQNAGRLAGLSGVAVGMVAHGVASLADAVDAVDASEAPAPNDGSSAQPPVARVPPPAPSVAPTATVRPATLDARTVATLTDSAHLLLVVNRHQAGPFANRYPYGYRDGEVRIETRSSSAMAQHVRRDGHVSLMLDEPATEQRLMVFGTARLLEGAAAAAGGTASTAVTASTADGPDAVTTPPVAVVHDRAIIVITPSHALRMPL